MKMIAGRMLVGLFVSGMLTNNVRAENQQDIQAILSEGWSMYRSEKASWQATDLIKQTSVSKNPNLGGYLSYESEKGLTTIFFSKGDSALVLASINFDTTINADYAQLDTLPRQLSALEHELHTIRRLTVEEINSSKLFKRYEHSNFNIIPLIRENSRKVFVLTGPTQKNEVIFGNDYVLTFAADGKLLDKQRIHKSMLKYPATSNEQDISSTYHTHLPKTGDMFTSTDVCTLLLYGHLTEWKTHIVMGANRTYVWDVKANTLAK